MTTDLEIRFFETFGIKPKKTRHSCNSFWEKGIEDCPLKKCDICTYKHETLEVYPEITDSVLLSLIKIICKENIISLTRMKNGSKEWAVYFGLDKNSIFYEKSFKDVILKGFIEYSNDIDIYRRVQGLFKEG